jgi:hypothetical protein
VKEGRKVDRNRWGSNETIGRSGSASLQVRATLSATIQKGVKNPDGERRGGKPCKHQATRSEAGCLVLKDVCIVNCVDDRSQTVNGQILAGCESGNRKVTALTDRSHPKPIPQVSRGQMEKPGGVLQRSNPQGVLIRGTGGEQDG